MLSTSEMAAAAGRLAWPGAGGGGRGWWFAAAVLEGANGAGASVSVVWSGAALPGYGLTPGASPGGFAFGLSTLNSSGAIPYAGQAPGAPLGTPSFLPPGQWW